MFTPRTGFELLCMEPAAVTNQNSWIKNVPQYALNFGVEMFTYKINAASQYIFPWIQIVQR